ncbi:DUF305 domain-containing protein [Planobispora longispora]|uniref:DUF305 domain-containing protein n=1 Tax=Planobispora longispora TaxID=28887 RepID=A0A8J3RN59_9ACTN|nr:DUF305 domain-containing protein [Planobispora longispora]BFE82785.1 hypothetical protein GCM10020093_053860 [Planobispora longispora]GIH78014.1 hypothetical protein Plo01_44430 [Planobispora longispora]
MKRSALTVALALTALAVSACGTPAAAYYGTGHGAHGTGGTTGGTVRVTHGGAGTDVAAGGFTADDVMFLQMMIPHDRRGVELAMLAATRSSREEVRTLAAEIVAGQSDQVQVMTDRLTAWKQPLETGAHAHDAHGGLHVTGPEVVAELAALNGAAFDTAFLNVLIGHQHNALDMARAEVKTGGNPETVELARQIDRSRSEQVRRLLAALSP